MFHRAYARLHELAQGYFLHERGAWTLQPTALIHEAYLRLSRSSATSWHSTPHFLSFAARVMRQILVDEARRRHYLKRRLPGGEAVTLVEGAAAVLPRPVDILDLDQALDDLEVLDARKAKIVQMRFFGGLTLEEVAEELGLSAATVHREWRSARAWLARQLEEKTS
jgi:RNA polymerase sigma factor (TIGR02999 family)